MLAAKYQDYMFDLIKKVIDEIGPRPSCSGAEKKLGRLLVEAWKPVCDRVDVESFTCSPTAMLGSLYLVVFLYFACIILYWFLPPLAMALAILNCSIVIALSRGLEYADFLFPRRQGENVVGTIQPKGQLAQRVIVSAHMDSAYESNLNLYLKSAADIVTAVGVLATVFAFCGSLAKTIAYFDAFSNEAALTGVGIAMIALSPVAVLFLVSTFWRPVLGASDNTSGVSVVAGLGRYLGEARRSGDWFPKRTEVVLLGTSSEEAGLRGAKRYVKRHLDEMKTVRTYCLNVDGIKDEKLLGVVKGETFLGAKHDPELVKMAQDAAASHDWPMAVKSSMVFGGSDAAFFSLGGISATWLSAYDHSRFGPDYHTRYDTYDRIRPESLSVMLQMVIDMIQRIDNG